MAAVDVDKLRGIAAALDTLCADSSPSVAEAAALMTTLAGMAVTMEALEVSPRGDGARRGRGPKWPALLQQSRVGKSVNALRRSIGDAAVVTQCRELLGKWREVAQLENTPGAAPAGAQRQWFIIIIFFRCSGFSPSAG